MPFFRGLLDEGILPPPPSVRADDTIRLVSIPPISRFEEATRQDVGWESERFDLGANADRPLSLAQTRKRSILAPKCLQPPSLLQKRP